MKKHQTKYILTIISCLSVLAAPICHAGILDAWRANDFCRKAVGTSEGRVIGKAGESADGFYACAYKGIAYAAPPVGELRWTPPREPARRSGVLYAYNYADDCVQCRIISNTFPISSSKTQSEDCLYLNIWRPAKAGKFPVMVWIHGGALIFGSGAIPSYDGTDLATRQDVVVVTINYRLGSLGFLAHEALVDDADGYDGGSTGNYGLLDQIAALKWVQNNIAAFGGNPDNVTIFGESAGAWSVFTLMSSPLAKGLFHKAIAQSGSTDASYPSDEAFALGQRFAALVGCDNKDAERCLRSRSAQLLVAADTLMLSPPLQVLDGIIAEPLSLNVKDKLYETLDRVEAKHFAFLPREDGAILPAQPFEVIRSRKHHSVPLMAGTNLRDPRFLVESTHESLVELFAGHRQDLFHYRFDYDDHYLGWLVGGFHSFEIPFVFNTMPKSNLLYGSVNLYGPLQKLRAKPLVNAVQGYWGNFAWSGNPNGVDHTGRRMEYWPAFNPYSGKNRMVLDLPLYLTSDTN
jgi:para-nitrobenzyl esterase